MDFLLKLGTSEAKVVGERLSAGEAEMNSQRKEIHSVNGAGAGSNELRTDLLVFWDQCKAQVNKFPQGSRL
jgi:hypothetical protein